MKKYMFTSVSVREYMGTIEAESKAEAQVILAQKLGKDVDVDENWKSRSEFRVSLMDEDELGSFFDDDCEEDEDWDDEDWDDEDWDDYETVPDSCKGCPAACDRFSGNNKDLPEDCKLCPEKDSDIPSNCCCSCEKDNDKKSCPNLKAVPE